MLIVLELPTDSLLHAIFMITGIISVYLKRGDEENELVIVRNTVGAEDLPWKRRSHYMLFQLFT